MNNYLTHSPLRYGVFSIYELRNIIKWLNKIPWSFIFYKHSKVVMAIFSNRLYGEIPSDSVNSYDCQLSGAWVYIGMPMCRFGKAPARRHGGMVENKVARWRTRWHGGTAMHQLARWCNGGTLV